jgi:O-antigen ligase
VLANAFVNHAHDDVLEAWLEGGAVSIILGVAFLIWFAFSAARIWRHTPPHAHAIDLLLARAATIVVPLLLAHSFVDYPLRTGAMMAVFAFSCALLVEPLVGASVRRGPHGAEARSEQEISRMPMPPATPKILDAAPARPRPGPPERWGEDVDWPDEWRK